MLRVNDLKLPLNGSSADLARLTARKLRIRESEIKHLSLCRRSIDARKKEQIVFVCAVEVELSLDEDQVLKKGIPGVNQAAPYVYSLPEAKKPDQPPVIIGAGPAGLFCALILAQAGQNPILIERGQPVEQRLTHVSRLWEEGVLNLESNVQFGEGGAGTFSDGKLQSGIKDKRIRKMLTEMVECGAPQEILYSNKPHIGTDYLHLMVKNIRKRILALGGQIHFGSKFQDVLIKEGRVEGAVCLKEGKELVWECSKLVLAIGHSARDTFEALYAKGLCMAAKPFAVGLRIEHQQALIDRAQYGDLAGHAKLGSADYKMAVHLPDGTGVYTFCMCPGGQVVLAASEEKRLAVNGMSYFARAGENANSAVLTAVLPQDLAGDHPLAGIEFQRRLEEQAYQEGGGNYQAPVQMVEDFLAGRPSLGLGLVEPSYRPGVRPGDLALCLPRRITQALGQGIREMDQIIPGFAANAVLTGVESRSSSPVRILRTEKCEAVNLQGLYPIGEGAGYAGGITSSAVDGIRCAESILAE